jgi:molybdate transport system substrate-binding protein
MEIDVRRRFNLLTMAMLLPAISVQAAEIRVIASPSVSTIMRELSPQFESATGHKLTVFYGLVPAQKQKIDTGDFDLAIIPGEVMDYEIAQGKIGSQTRMQIARTGLGVGVRSGAPKPSIDTVDGFKRALLDAKSVSYVTAEPSGRQVTQDFGGLGVEEAMKPKIVSKESTAQVWEAVASGEAELGFGFIPNVKSAHGVEFAGPFPDSLQFYTILAAGVGAAADQPDAAKAFIKFLANPDSETVIRVNGFEPPAH